MLQSATLEVIGDQRLHCEGCENRVMRLLKGLPGVARVRAQSSNQQVDVQFDPELLDLTTIADRLAQSGYETRTTSPRGQPT